MITVNQVQQIMPKISSKNLPLITNALNSAMSLGDIAISKSRMAMFIAQTAHESGEYHFSREVWGPSQQQLRYERDFAFAWPPTKQDQKNKLSWTLGNSEKGDGYSFRGWGSLQLTGRSNTLKASLFLFNDSRLVQTPSLLDDLETGLKGAVWYWSSHNLNDFSDKLDIQGATKAINGGLNGLAERERYFRVAMGVL